MTIKKLTTLLVVDTIEVSVSTWKKLGYEIAVRVPDKGTMGFAILNGPPGELMLQTKASLAEDLPDVAARNRAFVLYCEVDSLDAVRKTLPDAKVLVEKRTTFYGATESWIELESGVVMGLAQHGA